MSKKKLSILSAIIAVAVAITAVTIFSTPAGAAVVVKEFEPHQLLKETNFDSGNGLPWHICETAPAKADFAIKDGKYYVTVKEKNNSGGERWDLQFRHRALWVESGHTYTIKFTVQASKNCTIYPKIGDQGDPYTEDWNLNWNSMNLTANTPTTQTYTFTANRTAEVLEWAFHLADAPVGTTFWFDDMSLTDPQFPGHEAETVPDYREIRLNQLGYFPNRQKLATLHTDSTSPVTWELQNSSGNVVKTGKTKVFGNDKDSGEYVHTIDFTDFKTPGKNYKLVADSKPVKSGSDSEADSYPFDIADDMYSNLTYDSLKYFYQSRSGIPIQMPYCEESQYARAAGHSTDIAPTSTDEEESWDYNESFSVDMTGGWYDAGDHGKYVVNGGITVWTLQNMYERRLYNDDDISIFGDNTMNIPESGNKLPDVLDETRWHMEVMLKMQVPQGKDRAGMAFHKGHDESWTGLAVAPADDPKERIMKPPTTAATLNLAACGAQSYRLWQELDSTFANKCLSAAEVAWKAALANPAIYAPFDDAFGGGPYGDDYVKDDFYWAASELYAATGKAEYLTYIKNSPHYLEVPNYLTQGEETNTVGQFNWGNTAALGSLTLALGGSDLPSSELTKVRNNVVKAGDFSVGIQDKQGYGIPIEQCDVLGGEIKGYPWGSNSFVTNICIVLAYAYDYSNDTKYLDGVTESMDYMLGRNPNERAYITGYGDYAVKYPHHRFFANQVDSSFPLAPKGICVGGPNSGLQDPWVQGSGWVAGEMAPQKSYMDHIESWSTNECTINWNAPIAWVASFLDANGNDGGGTTPTTTAPVTTAPVTTAPVTTAPVTTAPVTTAPVTTAPVTTAPVTTAPVTTAPVTTAPVTTAPVGKYTVSYTQNDWGSGATVFIVIKNTGSTTINGWTLSFSFSGNQKITNLWSGTYSQSGKDITIKNASWNGTIAPGANINFGFNISYSGTNNVPTSFSLDY